MAKQITSAWLARNIYIRFIFGDFGREITKYTVIYGVHIRFWPTLDIGNHGAAKSHQLAGSSEHLSRVFS
jgi:hypothetical protein